MAFLKLKHCLACGSIDLRNILNLNDQPLANSYLNNRNVSDLISENLKRNKKINSKKLSALLINTRNANALTGQSGFTAIKQLANDLSDKLTKKQNEDEEDPKEIK